jgi:hypothetical protein
MFQLKTQSEEESHHTFDKHLAVAKALKVGGFALEIDSDSSVFAGLVNGIAHESPWGQMVDVFGDPR